MKAFEFCCPTKIICGEGSLAKIIDEMDDRGITRPMITTDANLVQLGVADRILEPLTREGIAFTLFDQIPPDSSLEVINEVVRQYLAQGCDGFIALGGGSVIDTTKGAAASLSYEGQDFASLQGSEILHNDLPTIIAVPTTAGTGSEATIVAVVKDTEAGTKLSYTSYRLVPPVAVLDPSLTTSLPPKLTATTGLDALTHAVEAYTSIQKNPVSDALALSAIKAISENLDRACRTPEDVDARCNLALASCMAGAAFSNAMVGIVHALGHSLGGLCHIPHGQAMAMLLPHCVRYNLDHGIHAGLYGELLQSLDPQKYAAAAPENRDEVFAALLVIQNAHFAETCGMPLTLRELGVSARQLPAIARQARYDGSALYNSEEITMEMALEILEAVY